MKYFLSILFVLIGISINCFAAQEITEENYREKLKEAAIYHKKGVNNYKASPQEGIEYYQKALDIRNAVYENLEITEDTILEGIIKGYTNIGSCYLLLGRFDQAKKYYDACLQKATIFQNKHQFTREYRIGRVYQGLGQISNRIGSLSEAENYFRQAINYYKQDTFKVVGLVEKFQVARTYNDISALYIRWERNPELILRYAQLALQECLPLIYKEEIQNNNFLIKKVIRTIIAARINEGHGYAIDNQNDLAEFSYLEALQLILNPHQTSYLTGNNTIWDLNSWELINEINQVYTGLFLLYKKRGQYIEAEATIKKAIAHDESYLKKGDYRSVRILLNGDYDNFGSILASLGKYDQAIQYAQQAIEIIVDDFEQYQDSDANPKFSDQLTIFDQIYLINALQGKADILQQMGQLDASLRTYQRALQFLDQYRLLNEDYESRIQLSNIGRDIYEGAIEVSIAQGDVNSAFLYAEQSKAFTLLQSIKDFNAIKAIGQQYPELYEQEVALRSKKASLKNAIDYEDDLIKKQDLLKQLIQITADQLALIEHIKQKAPEYFLLKYDYIIPSISQIQDSILQENQSLLEFFVGEHAIHAFILNKDGHEVFHHKIEMKEEELITSVDNMLNGLVYSSYSLEDIPDEVLNHYAPLDISMALPRLYAENAKKLYEQLFKPVEAQLKGDRILVITDSYLQKVPLSALVKAYNPDEIEAYNRYDYLGQSYQFSYGFSSALSQMMQEAYDLIDYQRPIVAFADSKLDGQAKYLEQLFDHQWINWNRSVTKFIGEDANKLNFQTLAANFRVIQLSLHGYLNNQDPNLSNLGFFDDPLFLYEIYNQPLNAQLVITSSCNAGTGKYFKGEGLMSLARAFAHAGSQSVITSLWEIPSEDTDAILKAFYKNLKKGISKDEALYLAKKNYISDISNPHPYYWAGLIALGDVAPIEIESSNSMLPILLIAGSLLVSLFYFWYRRRNRKEKQQSL